jgi:hypothetical protein
VYFVKDVYIEYLEKFEGARDDPASQLLSGDL